MCSSASQNCPSLSPSIDDYPSVLHINRPFKTDELYKINYTRAANLLPYIIGCLTVRIISNKAGLRVLTVAFL